MQYLDLHKLQVMHELAQDQERGRKAVGLRQPLVRRGRSLHDRPWTQTEGDATLLSANVQDNDASLWPLVPACNGIGLQQSFFDVGVV